MESMGSEWYKKIWTLDIKNQSWVEETGKQVDFIIRELGLKGTESILDLACGFGRHALEFARRGYKVTGVDITEEYVADAIKQAEAENLNVAFVHADIREVNFENEFDVVLNMGDGAIGYLEDETENLKIFDVIARALCPGGKHVMDIMSADYADLHFPLQLWDAGEHGLTLSRFEWDRQTKIMMYGQLDYTYGCELIKPVMDKGNPTRLYHLSEINDIMEKRGMQVEGAYCDFNGNPASEIGIQMICISKK